MTDKDDAAAMPRPMRLKPVIAIPDWWDVFCFMDEPTIICPDCDQESPALRDILAAVNWVADHYLRCPA